MNNRNEDNRDQMLELEQNYEEIFDEKYLEKSSQFSLFQKSQEKVKKLN